MIPSLIELIKYKEVLESQKLLFSSFPVQEGLR